MGTEREDLDSSIISQLRDDAERLRNLEMRLTELEQVRGELLESTNRLSDHLRDYRQGIDEWEWFFEHSPEILCIMSEQGSFRRINPAFKSCLGYTEQMLEGQTFRDLVHPDDRKVAKEVFEGLTKQRGASNFEIRFADSEGRWHWLSWHLPAVRPDIQNWYALAQDVTQSKQSEQAILYRATHDPLTDLYNRAAFEERMADMIALSQRNPGKKLVLYLIDLDRFKHINDEYGHPAGDELLAEVARRLKAMQRRGEMAVRLGGDEFAFLITGKSDVEVTPLAERIIQAVTQPVKLSCGKVRLGCSIGIAVYPDSAYDKESLISRADQAMYAIKKSGRGGFKVYSV